MELQWKCIEKTIYYEDFDLEKMLFKIVNMKEYNASEKKEQNNLIKELNLWNLTLVILDWSFSYYGDVYKFLNSGEKRDFFILSNNLRSVHIDPDPLIKFRSIIMEFTPNVQENSPFCPLELLCCLNTSKIL